MISRSLWPVSLFPTYEPEHAIHCSYNSPQMQKVNAGFKLGANLLRQRIYKSS